MSKSVFALVLITLLASVARADMYITANPKEGDMPLWINSGAFYTGNELYDKCQRQIAFCQGYIAGVADVLSAQNGNSICIPKGVVLGQLTDVVTYWLRDHPEKRQYTANSQVYLALDKAFHCPPTS